MNYADRVEAPLERRSCCALLDEARCLTTMLPIMSVNFVSLA